MRVTGPRQERRRHTRKYAEGELGPDRSFYFRGPEGALNLRAQNLSLFVQMADGVDDATWQHHLAAGDYSAWARDSIKDDELAADFAAVERDASLDPQTAATHQGGDRAPLHRPGVSGHTPLAELPKGHLGLGRWRTSSRQGNDAHPGFMTGRAQRLARWRGCSRFIAPPSIAR